MTTKMLRLLRVAAITLLLSSLTVTSVVAQDPTEVPADTTDTLVTDPVVEDEGFDNWGLLGLLGLLGLAGLRKRPEPDVRVVDRTPDPRR